MFDKSELKKVATKIHNKNMQKRLYEKQRGERLARQAEKVECVFCKCTVRRDKMPRHTRTKKHEKNTKINL